MLEYSSPVLDPVGDIRHCVCIAIKTLRESQFSGITPKVSDTAGGLALSGAPQ